MLRIDYLLNNAIFGLKRNRLFTALTVFTIAVGISGCVISLQVQTMLSGNPMPHKSERLFIPMIDPRDMYGFQAGQDPEEQLTYIDAMNLLEAKQADRQTVMSAGKNLFLKGADTSISMTGMARYVSVDFFPMFEPAFKYGQQWTETEDKNAARVVVLSEALNQRFFAGNNSIGEQIQIAGDTFEVIGVLDNWQPVPRFYDLNFTADGDDLAYIPFATAMDMAFYAGTNINCWGTGELNFDVPQTLPCSWIHFWVELSSPEQISAYEQFMVRYSERQKQLGRFEREPNVRLLDITQWLDHKQVVPALVKQQLMISLAILFVCLVNAAILLFAVYIRRSGEIALRRACGASKKVIFAEFLSESGVVGFLGGVLGCVFILISLPYVQLIPLDYMDSVGLDLMILPGVLVFASLTGLAAGLLPAWLTCGVNPATALRQR